MRKRVLAVVVSMLLVVSMTVPVFAAGSGNANWYNWDVIKQILGIKDAPQESSSSSSSSNSNTWTPVTPYVDPVALSVASFMNYNAAFGTGLSVVAAKPADGSGMWVFTSPLFGTGKTVTIQENNAKGDVWAKDVKSNNNVAQSPVTPGATNAAACLKTVSQ